MPTGGVIYPTTSIPPTGGVGRCAVGVAVLGVCGRGVWNTRWWWELRGQVRVASVRKNTEHD